MKGYHVLVIGSALLLVLGGFLVSHSFPNVNLDSTVTIPGGPSFYEVRLGVFAGLTVSVHYFLLSAGTVDVYVLDDYAYSTYQYSFYAPTSLHSETNSTAGTFAVIFPAGGVYHVVFNHHLSITGLDQTLQVTATASGTNVLYLGAGLGMIVLAGVLAVLAIVKRKAARRIPRGSPRADGQLLYKPRTRP